MKNVISYEYPAAQNMSLFCTDKIQHLNSNCHKRM